MKTILNRLNKKNGDIYVSYILVFLGQNLASILNIICVSLAIKLVGLDGNGIFILVQSYVFMMSDFFNMQTFNGIIKYMNIALKDKNLKAIKGYIKASLQIDLLTGMIAFLIGILGINLFVNFMDMNKEVQYLIIAFLPVVVFRNVSLGTCTGILRTYNKYDLITLISTGISIFKVIIYIAALWFTVDVMSIIVIELLVELINQIIVIGITYRQLKINQHHRFFNEKSMMTKEFFMFNFYNCIVTTIDLALGKVTNIIIGKWLGYNEVSILNVLEKLGGIFGKFSVPLNQIMYPEMCKAIANKSDRALKVFKKSVIITFPIGIIFWITLAVTYKYWIGFFIENYNMYFKVTMIYLGYAIFTSATTLIHPLLVAYNLVRYNIKWITVFNCLYLVLLPIMVSKLGLVGLIYLKLIQAIAMVISKYKIIIKYSDKRVSLI